MITAEALKTITQFGPKGLAVFLEQAGYKSVSFKSAKFLGITNGGQFCYSVTTDSGTGKVFVNYDQETGKVTAGY